MALTKNISLPFHGQDVEFKNVYIKVAEIVGGKNRIEAVVELNNPKREDADADTKHAELIEARRYAFVPVLEGSNFIAQAYDYLKTLPEFEGAVDC